MVLEVSGRVVIWGLFFLAVDSECKVWKYQMELLPLQSRSSNKLEGCQRKLVYKIEVLW